MGAKYTTTPTVGYNASPPSDAGAATEENRITWAKIKTKLPDPIKTALDSIDSKLVTAFDFGPSSKSIGYTTVAGDHLKTISCTAAITVSLMDAATATAGYTVSISNQSSGDVTIGRATAGDTINGTAANMTLRAKTAATLRVNASANGYEVIAVSVKELAELARTDGNFIVGDGTGFVAESGATARTSLGLGTAATQNTGTSGATVPLLNAANTFASGQVVGDGTGSAIARLNGGAANDRILGFRTGGNDRWAMFADSAAESGSNAGSDFIIARYSDAGAFIESAFSFRRSDGAVQVGTPTGGYQGNGTINAKAVYDDGTLLTCYVIEALQDGAVNLPMWDARTPDRKNDKGEVAEVRTHEPAARFAARAAVLLDPATYALEWKTKRHLPSMPSPAEWEAAGQKMSTGDLIQRLWETVELQAVHIEKLRARIEALGG